MTDELKKSTDFTCPECCQPVCVPGCAGLAIKDSVLPVRDAADLHTLLSEVLTEKGFQRYLNGDPVTVHPSTFNVIFDEARAALAQAAPASPTLAPEHLAIVQTWPARIWLQCENEHGDAPEPFEGAHEVTWCQDHIGTHDIAYVRADLAPASPASAPVAPPVTPKHIEQIKDILLWPVTEDDARTARNMLQSLHFDLSMNEDAAFAIKVEVQQAGVPDGWSMKMHEDGWIFFKRPDDMRATIAPGETLGSHGDTLYMLMKSLAAAPLPPVVARKDGEVDLLTQANRDGWAEGMQEAQSLLASEIEDAARLDWLETKVVNVRDPLRYGSRDMFWSNPPDDDGETGLSDIRKAIDAARLPGTNGSGVGDD